MKKSFKISILSILFLSFLTTYGQVGIGTNTPDGMLDTQNSTNYGIIFPRVVLTATNVAAPVVNPNGGNLVAGTAVYNTNTTSTGTNDVYPGIYAWDGSRWIAQYLREDSAIYEQTTLGQRIVTGSTSVNTGSSDWVDVNGLGNGSTFTPKYSGTYRVKANFNFGSGKITNTGDTIDMATQEGYFRFTFDGTQYLIYTHAYGVDNAYTGLYYDKFRHDTSLVLYRTLRAGQTYNFRLEIDVFVSSQFENGGNSGDGRSWVGIGVPCTVEFTYVEE